MSGFSKQWVGLAILLAFSGGALGAPIRTEEAQGASPFLSTFTGLTIFAVATGWVAIFAAAGLVARSTEQVPDLPFPNLTPCTTTENVLKNILEVVLVFPCCASIKCSFTIGIWLARGSPLVVLLKVAGASLSSGTAACLLGYLGAYLARSEPADIQVTWDSASDGRVRRMVPPTPSPSPLMSHLVQACLVASLPLLAVACALPVFNGIVGYFTPKVGKTFSICLVTGVAILLAAGVFLVAFSAFLLGPLHQQDHLTRHKREAFSSSEVESLLGINLPLANTSYPSLAVESTPTPWEPSSAVRASTNTSQAALNLGTGPETTTPALPVLEASSPTDISAVASTLETSSAVVDIEAASATTTVTTANIEITPANISRFLPTPSVSSSSSVAPPVTTTSETPFEAFTTTNFPVKPSLKDTQEGVTNSSQGVSFSDLLDLAQAWLVQHSPTGFTQFCQDRSSILGLCLAITLSVRLVTSFCSCCRTFRKNQVSKDIKKIRSQLNNLNDRLASPSETHSPPATLELDELPAHEQASGQDAPIPPAPPLPSSPSHVSLLPPPPSTP